MAEMKREAVASMVKMCVLVAVAWLSTANAQMQTPGKFAVSQTGAATYTIPIRIPPGIAGVEPKLELTYSSQAGNGLLGVGWSLNGLSSITVCPQTKGQDGASAYAGKTFYTTPNTRFCLNGQRLVPVPLPAATGLESGSAGVSGANQTYYRTELESFDLVQSIGATNGLPTYFKIIDRQGRTLEYGNTTDSRVANAAGVSREWKLDKVMDVSGNYMTFTYSAPDTTTDQSYPITISYTANDKVSQSAVNTIAFNYNLDSVGKTTRPDHVFAHYPGGTVNLMARMSSITIKSSGNLVRQYGFSYDQSPYTLNSRVNQIQECGSDLSTCFPAVKFTWLDSLAILNGPVSPQMIYDAAHSFVSSDSWFAVSPNYGAVPTLIRLYSNGGNLAVDAYGDNGLPTSLATNLGAYNSSDKYVFGDMSGDGRADLIRISSNGSTFATKVYWSQPIPITSYASTPSYANLSVTYNGGANNSTSTNFPIVVDSTGDGVADLMLLNVSTPTSSANPALPYGLSISSTLASGVLVKPAGALTSATTTLANIPSVSATAPPFAALFGDFTGDGVIDLALYSQSVAVQNSNFFNIFDLTSNIPDQYYSTSLPKAEAAAFYLDQYPASTSLSVNGGATWLAGDVTGDGLADLIKISNANGQLSLSVYVNDGKAWAGASSSASQSTALWGSGMGVVSAADKFFVVDVNGDGRDDVVHIFNEGGKTSIDYIVSDGASFRMIHQCVKCDGYAASDKWVMSRNTDGGVFLYRIYADVGQYIGVSGFPNNVVGYGDQIMVFNDINTVLYMPLGGVRGTSYTIYKAYQYPQQPLSQPINIVSKVTSKVGASDLRITKYSYDSAAIEVGTGRGFLGFNWVESWDSRYGLDARTTYRQDFPFVGQVQKVERGVQDLCAQTCSTTVSYGTTAYQYMCTDFTAAASSVCSVAPGKHYFLYQSDIQETGNYDITSTGDVGGALPGFHTTQTYDLWGNLTQLVTTKLNSNGNATDFSKAVNSVYAPAQVSNWRFNKLLRTSVTATGH